MTALDLKARISDEIGKLAEWDKPLTLVELARLDDIWDGIMYQANADAWTEENRNARTSR